MQIVRQGGQTVIVLSEGERQFLTNIIRNGLGDSPSDVGAKTRDELWLWNDLNALDPLTPRMATSPGGES